MQKSSLIKLAKQTPISEMEKLEARAREKQNELRERWEEQFRFALYKSRAMRAEKKKVESVSVKDSGE